MSIRILFAPVRKLSLGVILALLATLLPVSVASGPAANAAMISGVRLNRYEARLVSDVNNARRNHGLGPLTVLAGPTDVARRWAWHLANSRSLSHNPSLLSQISNADCPYWTMVAENVAYASSGHPDAMFDAYMGSAPHRANILDPSARYLGLGVVERGDRAYNTMDFVAGCRTGYGLPRTPAQGMYIDRYLVTSTDTVAGFETGSDQRLFTTHSGAVGVSRPWVDKPTSGDNAARFTTWRKSTSSGYSELKLSVALDLRDAKTLSMRVSATDPAGRSLTLQARLGHTYGTSVFVGSIHATATPRWVTFTIPSGARVFRNRVMLCVRGRDLDALSGRLSGRTARVGVYSIRVGS